MVVIETFLELPTLGKKYKLARYADNHQQELGNQVNITSYEQYGDETEIIVNAFSQQTEKTGQVRTAHASETIQLTTQHQKEHDAWWAQNKRQTKSGTWIAHKPDTTDDIAFQMEMLEHFLTEATPTTEK